MPYKYTGPVSYTPVSTYGKTEEADDRNTLKDVAKSVGRGAVEGLAASAHGIDYLTDLLGYETDSVSDLGTALSDYANLELSPTKETFGMQVAGGFGSALTNLVPAILVTIASGGTTLPAAATSVSAKLGIPIYASLEALQEAGSTYDRVLSEGLGDEDAAKRKASAVFAANIALVSATAGASRILGPTSDKLMGRTLRGFAGEGTQEATQAQISALAEEGKPAPLRETVEAGLVGGIVGGTFGAISPRTDTPNKSEDLVSKEDSGVVVNKGTTVTEDQSNSEADRIAEDNLRAAQQEIQAKADTSLDTEHTIQEEQAIIEDQIKQQQQQEALKETKLTLENKKFDTQLSTTEGFTNILTDKIKEYKDTNKDAYKLLTKFRANRTTASIAGVDSLSNSKLVDLLTGIDDMRRSDEISTNPKDLAIFNKAYLETESLIQQHNIAKSTPTKTKAPDEAVTTLKEHPDKNIYDNIVNQLNTSIGDMVVEHTDYDPNLGHKVEVHPKGVSKESAMQTGLDKTIYAKSEEDAIASTIDAAKTIRELNTNKQVEPIEKASPIEGEIPVVKPEEVVSEPTPPTEKKPKVTPKKKKKKEPTVYYHGSNLELSKGMDLPKGHRGYFLTVNKNTARKFGKNLYTAKPDVKKIFDYRDETAIDELMILVGRFANPNRLSGIRRGLAAGGYNQFEDPEIYATLMKLGYDANYQLEDGQLVLRVFHRKDIKSFTKEKPTVAKKKEPVTKEKKKPEPTKPFPNVTEGDIVTSIGGRELEFLKRVPGGFEVLDEDLNTYTIKYDDIKSITPFAYLRTKGPKAEGLSVVKLKNATKRIRAKLKNTPVNINILSSPKSLARINPKAYQYMKDTGELSAAGLYTNGTIYLFASNIGSAREAKEALWHEAGHYSFRQMLGNRIVPELNKVYTKDTQKIHNYAELYGYTVDNNNKAEWTEEYIIKKWTDYKTQPIGKKLMRSIMEKLGMIERRDFYEYFKPMYNLIIKSGDIKPISVKSIGGYAYKRKSLLDKVDTPLARKAMLATGNRPTETFVDKIKELTGRDWYTEIIDKMYPIYKAGNAVGDTTGYMYHRLANTTNTNFSAILEHGLPKFDKNTEWMVVDPDGKGGLNTVFKNLGVENAQFFMTRQMAKSADDVIEIRRKQYTKELKDKNKYSKEAVEERVDDFKKKLFGKDPETDDWYDYDSVIKGIAEATDDLYKKNKIKWDKAEARLKEFNVAILDLGEASGVINPELRAEWERSTYVPFNREIVDWITKDKITKLPKSAGKSLGRIQKLQGGEGQVGNPTYNLLANYYYIVNESLKNIARVKALPALVETGAISQEVPATMKSKKGVIEVRFGGKSKFFKVEDPAVYTALTSTNNALLNNFVIRGMRRAKGLLTFGVSFGGGFRIANVTRDATQAAIVDKAFNPFKDTFRGINKVLKTDPAYIRLMSLGGTFGDTFVRLEDTKSMKENIKRLAGVQAIQKQKWYNPVTWFKEWERFGVALENASRVGLYEKKLAAGATEIEAALAARDLMDFSRHGNNPTVALLTAIIPFLNARIQGLDKVMRSGGAVKAFKDEAQLKNFYTRGLVLAGLSMLLFAFNYDKDEYQDLPEWDKFSNMHAFVNLNDNQYDLRVPIPFEIGLFFNKLPEIFTGAVINKDYKLFLDFLKFSFTQTFELDIRNIQAIKPLYEIATNRSLFSDSPIVPLAEKNLEKYAQYGDNTSATARYFGKAFNVSPRKIDHLVKGYTGAYGTFVLGVNDMANRMIYDVAPDMAAIEFIAGEELPQPETFRIGEWPTIGRFIKSGAPKRIQQETAFYDNLGDLQELYSTVLFYRRMHEPEKFKEALAKYRKEAPKLNLLESYKDSISTINASIKLIRRSTTMSTKEKDFKLQRLYRQKNKLIKEAVERYNQMS